MPEQRGSEQEPKKRPFIREKIAKPPMSKRQAAGRLLLVILLAAVGGTAAGVSFAVAGPLADRYLASESQAQTDPVIIPTDVPETVTEAETSAGETISETESEDVEELVQSALADYEYSPEDMNQLYEILRTVVQEVDKGIVEVHSVRNDTDLFNNPVENSGLYGGAVIASTAQDFLILTPCKAVEQADSIKVKFGTTEVAGQICGLDRISGLAVVTVDASLLDETVRQQVQVLPLGNSYTVKQGDLLVAMGAPAGFVHSSTYGTVAYVLRNVQVEDGVTRLLYADIRSDETAGTFLFNTAGELVGVASADYGDKSREGMTTVMAISDYKTILEKLSNGLLVPYLGVRGQEVTAAMAQNGLPLGVYVSGCEDDSPAYNAGIQSGDVIVQMEDKAITTMRDYQNQMETLTEGQEISVTVKRKGIDDYIELEFQVIVGAR